MNCPYCPFWALALLGNLFKAIIPLLGCACLHYSDLFEVNVSASAPLIVLVSGSEKGLPTKSGLTKLLPQQEVHRYFPRRDSTR